MVEATATKKSAPKVAPKAIPKTSSEAQNGLPAQAGPYAVFATGGKQYRVKAGDRLKIEILPRSTSSGQAGWKEGDSLTFDTVLMTDNGGSEVTLGNPFIKGVTVTATLVKMGRNKTVDVIKYKQKSRYFKRYGHRQPHFEIRIDSVN